MNASSDTPRKPRAGGAGKEPKAELVVPPEVWAEFDAWLDRCIEELKQEILTHLRNRDAQGEEEPS